MSIETGVFRCKIIQPDIAGFEDGRGLQTLCGQPLEARKGKEMSSSLEPKEHGPALPTP